MGVVRVEGDGAGELLHGRGRLLQRAGLGLGATAQILVGAGDLRRRRTHVFHPLVHLRDQPAQAGLHGAERAQQVGHLVAAAGLHRLRKVASGDAVGHLQAVLQRPHDAARQHHRGDQAQKHRQPAEHQHEVAGLGNVLRHDGTALLRQLVLQLAQGVNRLLQPAQRRQGFVAHQLPRLVDLPRLHQRRNLHERGHIGRARCLQLRQRGPALRQRHQTVQRFQRFVDRRAVDAHARLDGRQLRRLHQQQFGGVQPVGSGGGVDDGYRRHLDQFLVEQLAVFLPDAL